MEIRPIKKQKLNDLVFDQMKRLIIEGNWSPGDRIPSENTLATRFGVSRVTVRQALERLTAMGMIETHPGLGRYVSVFDVGQFVQKLGPDVLFASASMQEVNEFRCMLDNWSAAKAAELAGEEDIRALEENYAAMQACVEQDDRRRAAALDLEFHTRIGAMTRNSLVKQTYAIVYEALRDSFLQIMDRMGFIGLDYHRRMIEAIRAHDSEAAWRASDEHLKNNSRYF